MHLTPDALHRILSVPVVDTMAVVSYQLQDLWISPVAATTATLSTLQVSQLMTDGVFWRLEPMLFCDQSVRDLGQSIVMPEDGSAFIRSAISSYPSQYELTCRTGMLGGSFAFGTLQKNDQSNYYSQTIENLEVGSKVGALPYVYKPISVSKTAFSKLTEWPHGFTVTRTVEYANPQLENVVDMSDGENDQIGVLGYSEDPQTFYDRFVDALVGLDESFGTDEKHFTFAPNLELSALNSCVLQTLADPKALGWQYIPLESKTTSQPFPTSTDQQSAYITAEVAKLFPLSTAPIAPVNSSEAAALQTLAIRNLESATVQYLRDTASNYCSQFDWAQQARDFDAVALRQQRLLDFNAIPIAPLEMSKDYATLTTAPDAGLSCYGDLPAIAWAPDPTDDSKVFALCRYRPPMRVPLPDWSWGNIGLPSHFSNAQTKQLIDEGPATGYFVVYVPERKPFVYLLELEESLSGTQSLRENLAAGNQFGFDWKTTWPPGYTYSRKVVAPRGYRGYWTFSPFLGEFHDPLKCLPLGASENTNPGYYNDLRTSFIPAFSPSLCVKVAPRYLSIGVAYVKENPDNPYAPLQLIANVALEKTGNGTNFAYKVSSASATDEGDLSALDGFRVWANTFFLDQSSYSEIGRYRWLDENETAMVDLPFYGHSAIFNSFNIDISLRPAPQG